MSAFAGGTRSNLAPPSMAAARPPPSNTDRKLLFALDDLGFLPEGVKHFKELVAQRCKDMKVSAQIQYNKQAHAVVIACEVHQVPNLSKVLENLVRDFVRGEGADIDYDDNDGQFDERPLDSSMLRRLSSSPTPKQGEDDSQTAAGSESTSTGTRYPEAIRYYQFKEIWIYSHAKKDIDDVISDRDLRTLEKSLGCQMQKVLNDQCIYIGAHQDGKCDRAVYALNIIRKNAELKAGHPRHEFYTEATENAKLILQPFVDVKKRYFETTLIERFREPLYDVLKTSCVTVRCCPYDPLKAAYVPYKIARLLPASQYAEGLVQLRDWNNYVYRTKGPDFNGGQETTSTQSDKVDDIFGPAPRPSIADTHRQSSSHDLEGLVMDWANKLPDPTEMDKQIPVDDNSMKFDPDVKPVAAGEPDSNWDKYQEYDPSELPKNIDDLTTQQAQASKALVLRSPFPILDAASAAKKENVPPSNLAPLESHHQSSNLSDLAQIFLPSTSFTTNEQSQLATMYEPAKAPTRSLLDSPPRFCPRSIYPDLQTSQSTSQQSQALVLRHPLDDDHSDFQYEPLRPIRTSSPARTIPDVEVYIPPPHVECLIDFDRFDLAPELMKTIGEPELREFHQTMQQKAPRRNPYPGRLPTPSSPRKPSSGSNGVAPPLDPSTTFQRSLNNKFEELIGKLRVYRGELVVEAEFGRIMLRKEHIPEKFITVQEKHTIAKKMEEMESGLLGKKTRRYFTNVLTAHSDDIHYLIDMRHDAGNKMWVQMPMPKKVEYTFLFIDKKQPWIGGFAIDIDAETFETSIKMSPQNLGVIYVHGTKRHWDFRILAKAISNSSKTIDKSFEELAKTLKESLVITPGSNEPSIRFTLPESSPADFLHVTIHCTTQYWSRDANSIIKITQVTELDCDHQKVESTQSDSFSTKRAVSDQGQPAFWYKVSISSLKANKLLEENKTLGVGQEAKWMVGLFNAAEAAKAMYGPACTMLRQMDGVGAYNDNGMRAAGMVEDDASELFFGPPKPPAKKFSFW